MDRRSFLKSAATLTALAACGDSSTEPTKQLSSLSSRPRTVARTLQAGTTRMNIGDTSVVVELPSSALAKSVIPTLLFMHGANRTVEPFLDAYRPIAEKYGVMVVMPYALRNTWDAIYTTGFGPDVKSIDAILTWLFGAVSVDPARLALSGFSDGATYALGLGRANGNLFSRVIAHSPGFMLDVTNVGKPPIVISHGTLDSVLPYDNARYTIYPALRSMGYDVDFRTFEGGHSVPLSVVDDQMRLLSQA
jgi:phospholipase/carboxylesterase